MIYDVAIIGSGPAGLTASIYTSRAFLKTILLTGSEPGGQLMQTTEVENFPGFPEGIKGPELMQNILDQSKRFNTHIINQNVEKISGNATEGFKLVLDNEESYEAKTVLIATGASAKWLGIESETRLRGKGVSACATCDGFFFKDKIIAVVGGGDSAMEEATYLTKYASKVYILSRASKGNICASKYMYQKALENPKITFMYNTEVKEILGDSFVSGLVIVNNETKSVTEMSDVQGVFIAIGHFPSTGFLKGFVDLDEKGYIKIVQASKTSREGVFVAGDAADPHYRQAITAAGMGCVAALDIERYLTNSQK